MNNGDYRMLGVWSGLAFILLWGTAFALVAQWVPPYSPNLDASAVAALFTERSVEIRIAMVLMSLGSVLYLPWTMMICELMKQTETRSNFLTGTQLMGGLVSQLSFFIPSFFWAAAAFRPERSAELIQLSADQGWLIFITAIGPFILQYTALAIVIFTDKKPEPTLPRWLGYLQIWISLSFVPAILAFFMKTGPFAWNGIFTWWLPLTIFTIWFIAMFIECRKALLLIQANDSKSGHSY